MSNFGLEMRKYPRDIIFLLLDFNLSYSKVSKLRSYEPGIVVLDHGSKHRQSDVICQKDINLVLNSTGSGHDTEFNTFLQTHGDAIKDVGLRVVRIHHCPRLSPMYMK